MHLEHQALSGLTGIKTICFSTFTENKKNNYLSLKEAWLPACQLRVSEKCISKFFSKNNNNNSKQLLITE